MRDAWLEAFPKIMEEGGQPGHKQAGLVAFLRERLLDLGPIVGETDNYGSQLAPSHLSSPRLNSLELSQFTPFSDPFQPTSPTASIRDHREVGEVV